MECLHCQQLIKAGRADRKFCSDACKNAYHNKERQLEDGEIKQLIMVLKQNRRILNLLLGDRDELYIPREVLQKRGFDFDYHTHRIVSGHGNTFVLNFNYGYRDMEDGRLKIVKWKRE